MNSASTTSTMTMGAATPKNPMSCSISFIWLNRFGVAASLG
jgi:hypothetical protein